MMERLIFERLEIECSFNINVSTLNRLSKNILAETKAKYSTISKIGGIILLKKVLNENRELITSFKNNKNSKSIYLLPVIGILWSFRILFICHHRLCCISTF